MPRPIYVEIEIRADLERVWQLTQEAALHARWDARFSSIQPEPDTGGARRFRYERALPLHVIRGTGISIGERLGAAAPSGTITDEGQGLSNPRGAAAIEPPDA